MPKIHNHYVPKFYLKGFTEVSDSEMMFVYQKGTIEPFRTQIKNIGNEKGLYPDELEIALANDIEKSANPILQKLRNFELISEDEKLEFSRYMFSMWLRVPKHLGWVIEKSPKIMDKTFSDVEKQLQQLAEKYPDKAYLVNQRIKQLHDIRTNKVDEFIKGMWLKNIPVGIDRPPVQILANMEWRFLESDSNQPFVTSDNPLFYFESFGIGNEKSEVSFPLSKNLVLWAKWKMEIPSGFHKARTQFVKEINRRTISSALKFIFSPQTAYWIPILLSKKRIRLNRIV
ncbi:MAG: DUF4238 domain-containing protein [Anaerolineales bacterium]|nr:DUF4238 domain-containing protein [Anaerolineales bacterium]